MHFTYFIEGKTIGRWVLGSLLVAGCQPEKSETSAGETGSSGSASASSGRDESSTSPGEVIVTGTSGGGDEEGSTSPGEVATGSSSDTGIEPGRACEELLTEEECQAAPPIEEFGYPPCAWAQVEVWGGDMDACAELSGAGRCLAMSYAGDGCGVEPECANERLYFRELGGGQFEVFSHPTTCGLEPGGWQQCFVGGPAVCECFCDSAVP